MKLLNVSSIFVYSVNNFEHFDYFHSLLSTRKRRIGWKTMNKISQKEQYFPKKGKEFFPKKSVKVYVYDYPGMLKNLRCFEEILWKKILTCFPFIVKIDTI